MTSTISEVDPSVIPLSVALQRVQEAEWAVEAAKTALDDARADVALAYCDHPDWTGFICDHCGQYTDPTPEELTSDAWFRDYYADCHQVEAIVTAGHLAKYSEFCMFRRFRR